MVDTVLMCPCGNARKDTYVDSTEASFTYRCNSEIYHLLEMVRSYHF